MVNKVLIENGSEPISEDKLTKIIPTKKLTKFLHGIYT
jgi:hypothetical protein